MLLASAAQTPVMFFGGKGGVGKTTTAAATAVALATHPLADRGRRVLLISTDPAHNVGHVLHAEVGNQITTVPLGSGSATIDALEINPDQVASEHFDDMADVMQRMLPAIQARRIKQHIAMAATSPGAHEAALLERLARVVLEAVEKYDHVIVDTAPSGHTSRLLDLPTQLTQWMDVLLGQRDRAERFTDAAEHLDHRARSQSSSRPSSRNQRIRQIITARRDVFQRFAALLTDPEHCQFFLVLAPERMPVLETIELARQLGTTGVHVGGCVVNRCSPTDAGEFLAARAQMERQFLDQLRAGLPQAPVWTIPLLPGDVTGPRALWGVAEYLAREP
ncbi:ArsA family ATPase [Corynebacterium falsenii]